MTALDRGLGDTTTLEFPFSGGQTVDTMGVYNLNETVAQPIVNNNVVYLMIAFLAVLVEWR